MVPSLDPVVGAAVGSGLLEADLNRTQPQTPPPKPPMRHPGCPYLQNGRWPHSDLWGMQAPPQNLHRTPCRWEHPDPPRTGALQSWMEKAKQVKTGSPGVRGQTHTGLPAHLSLSCDPLLLLLLLSGGALAGGSGGRVCRPRVSPRLLRTRLSASASQA